MIPNLVGLSEPSRVIVGVPPRVSTVGVPAMSGGSGGGWDGRGVIVVSLLKMYMRM